MEPRRRLSGGTEHEHVDENRPTYSGCGGRGSLLDQTRVDLTSAVTVGTLVVLVSMMALVGTVTAQDADAAEGVFEDQVISQGDEVLVEDITAEDGDGNNVGGTLVVARTITDGSAIEEVYVAGIEERNDDTLDGDDVAVDVTYLSNEGSSNVGNDISTAAYLLPESVANDEFSGVDAGDVLDVDEDEDEVNALLLDSVLEQSDSGAAPQGYLYEAEADAADVSVTQDELDSITVEPDTAAHLAEFADAGTRTDDEDVTSEPDDFRVSVSDERLEPGDDDEEASVLAVSGTQSEDTDGGLTFDLSGQGLEGDETLYVNVHNELLAEDDDVLVIGRDGNAAESFEQDVSSEFTLTVEGPDDIQDVSANPAEIDPGETSTITATVVDGDNDPFEGTEVEFDVDGEGDLNVIQDSSDEDGEVEAEYTGEIDENGETVEVTVEATTDGTVEGDTTIDVNQVSVNLEEVPDPVEPVDGGEANEVELTATVEGDSPIQGEDVTFSVDEGSGELQDVDPATNADGEATAVYVVGDGDWEGEGGVGVSVELDADSDVDAAENFDVDEPEAAINVGSAQDVIAPTGENEITATVTYEEPFDDNELSGVDVAFGITGEGNLVDADDQTDADGEATATYEPVEAAFGDTVEIEGSLNDADTTTFEVQEPVEIDATAELGATAPPGGVDVTFELRDDGGETVNTLTDEVNEGSADAAVTFDEDSDGEPLAEGEYTVEVTEANGYETGVEETVNVDEGETGDATVELGAEDTELDVAAELGVTAPDGGLDVDVVIDAVDAGTGDVEDPELLQDTVPLDAGDQFPSGIETEYEVDAVDHDQEYRVTVSAENYDDAEARGYVAPGGEDEIDAGTLEPNPLDILVTSSLSVTLDDGVDVTYVLEGPEGEQEEIDEDVTETSSAVFGSVDALDNDDEYTVTVDVDGFETGAVEETTPGAPGEDGESSDESLGFGELEAETVAVDYEASLETGAPNAAFPVGIDVTVPEGEDVEDQHNLDAGETTVDGEVDVDAIDAGEEYTVTVSADGYDDATGGGYAPPSETAEIDAGQLDAEDVTVTADAELSVGAPDEDFAVTYDLVGEPEQEEVTVADGETDVEQVSFDGLDAIETDESYEVEVTAEGYDAATDSTYVAPGGEETVEDLTLGAGDVTLNADAQLDTTAPEGGVDVTYELDGETHEVEVEQGDDDIPEVTFESLDALETGESYEVEVTAEGYDAATDSAYVPPGGEDTVDDLTLEAEDVTVEAVVELNVTVPDAELEFELLDDEAEVDDATATVDEGDETVSVGFEPADPLDFGDEYTVTVGSDAYKTEGVEAETAAEPGAEETANLGEILPEESEVDPISAFLEAEPAEDTTVEFSLVNTDRNAEVDTRTDTVEADGTATDDVAFTLNYTDDEVGVGDEYEIEMSAVDGNTNYSDGGIAFSLAPPQDLGFLNDELEAENAEVDVQAELQASPGEESTVTYELRDSDGELIDESTGQVEGITAEEVNFELDFSSEDVETGELEVTAEVTEGNEDYSTDSGTVEIAPGSQTTADSLSLEADDATVDVDAELVVQPGEETEVTFELINEDGETVGENTEDTGGTETGTGTLTADFSDEATVTGDYTVRATTTDGNTDFNAEETGIGELTPGSQEDATGELELSGEGTVEDTLYLAEGTSAVQDGEVTVEVTVVDGESEEYTEEFLFEDGEAETGYVIEDVAFGEYGIETEVTGASAGEADDYEAIPLSLLAPNGEPEVPETGEDVTVNENENEGIEFFSFANGDIVGTLQLEEDTAEFLDDNGVELEVIAEAQNQGEPVPLNGEGSETVRVEQDMELTGESDEQEYMFSLLFDDYTISAEVTGADVGDAEDYNVEINSDEEVTLDGSEVDGPAFEVTAEGDITGEVALEQETFNVLGDGDTVRIEVEAGGETDVISLDGTDRTAEYEIDDLVFDEYEVTASVESAVSGEAEDYEAVVTGGDDEVTVDSGENEGPSFDISGEGYLTGQVSLDVVPMSTVEDDDFELEVVIEDSSGDTATDTLVVNGGSPTAEYGVPADFDEYEVTANLVSTDIREPDHFGLSRFGGSGVVVNSTEKTGPTFEVSGNLGGGGGGSDVSSTSFTATGFNAGSAEYTVGDIAGLSGEVEMTGGADGTATVRLFHEGDEVDSVDADLIRGETVDIDFSHELEQTGEYEVTVDGNVMEEFVVEAEEDIEAEEGETAEEDDDGAEADEATSEDTDESEDGDQESDDEEDMPGFTAVAALIALVVALVVVRRD